MGLLRRRAPHPLLFAALGVVVGLVFATIAYRTWSRDRDLREHGAQTGARVVEVTGSGKGRRVYVEFTAGGRQVRAEVEGRSDTAGARVGDELPVRYDTRDPARDVYDARRSDQYKLAYLTGACALVGLVGAPAIAWFALRRRQPAAA
ncbi:DUF3592 domain-containing protein [Dactylosporangium aurantiacum]|uniref:DUF3592 domain-containing protein n=1 Tax=Dactylosporangium aurantiacum TaxID=35754 RepID=A0A9Q9ISA3_9ACTN|nr:DUF3592 domain-containing protein [Dactylosporangium aurantiacum]MDG6103773.1 DUF3592 domain-containing protein [Dactylosporangium aurantiacum]UWZ59015.1 DUF3592 domain-containing protein [Dactylosporangium aurantiacum]